MGWGTPCASSRFQQKMGHCKGVGCNRSGAFWVWEYHCCPEWSFGYELPGRESSENWTWNICAIVSLRFGWFAASSSLIVATLSLSLSLSLSVCLCVLVERALYLSSRRSFVNVGMSVCLGPSGHWSDQITCLSSLLFVCLLLLFLFFFNVCFVLCLF